MIDKKNSKLHDGMVYVGMGFPILVLYNEWDILWAVVAAGLGAWMFMSNYTHNSKLTPKSIPRMGPQEPFRQDMGYDQDEFGKSKPRPPRQYYDGGLRR